MLLEQNITIAMTPAMTSVAWLAVLVAPVLLYALSHKIGIIMTYLCALVALWVTITSWQDLELASSKEVSIYLPWAMALTLLLHGIALLAKRISVFGNLSGIGLVSISVALASVLDREDLENLDEKLILKEEEQGASPQQRGTPQQSRIRTKRNEHLRINLGVDP